VLLFDLGDPVLLGFQCFSQLVLFGFGGGNFGFAGDLVCGSGLFLTKGHTYY
jgi:hypothetical protein